MPNLNDLKDMPDYVPTGTVEIVALTFALLAIIAIAVWLAALDLVRRSSPLDAANEALRRAKREREMP